MATDRTWDSIAKLDRCQDYFMWYNLYNSYGPLEWKRMGKNHYSGTNSCGQSSVENSGTL